MSLTSRFGYSLLLGLLLGLITPAIIPTVFHSGAAIAQAQSQSTTFSDVPASYWAYDYIQGLAKLNVVSGFPDGKSHPEEPVTRAQFAVVLRQAFLKSQSPSAQLFSDVRSNYWAADAMQPDRLLRPKA